jgi:hypothetical protein
VEAAVDVEDLAGDRAREVREQEQIAPATGPASSVSQPSGACLRHMLGELGEAGDAARGDRAERPARHEVHAHALRPEVARQVPRTSPPAAALGHAHPVIDGHATDASKSMPTTLAPFVGYRSRSATASDFSENALVGERGHRALGGVSKKLPPERPRGERDRVQHAVDAPPALLQVRGHRR